MSKVIKTTTAHGRQAANWQGLRTLAGAAGEFAPAPVPQTMPPPPPMVTNSQVEEAWSILAVREAELAAMQAEMESLKEAAWREGHAAATAALEAAAAGQRAEAEAALAAARTEVEALRREAQAEREHILAKAHSDLLALAVTLARRVVVAELSLRPEILADMVFEALKQLTPGTEATVHLHPQDMERMEVAQQTGKGPAEVRFLADPALEPGEFMVCSPRGEVDGRLVVQFSEMEAFLNEEAGEAE